MYRAKVLAYSSAPESPSLMTVEIEFPRVVLAEVATHRVCRNSSGDFELITHERTTTEDISKNSASSRAIPLYRMIQKVCDDPYIPEKFSAAGAGMQEHGWLNDMDHIVARNQWLHARDDAVTRTCLLLTREDRQGMVDKLTGDARDLVKCQLRAGSLLEKSVHKQDVNRLLEPFSWVTQILTADEWGWNNFFTLRCHKDAAPAFRKAARMIYLEKQKATPERLDYGQWHLPFIRPEEKAGFSWNPINEKDRAALPDLIQFSAARCAWVSYESHDKDSTPEKMKATFDRLIRSAPVHASPVEHQATPMHMGIQTTPFFKSNLRGWIQARKLIPNERMDIYSPSEDEIASWGL